MKPNLLKFALLAAGIFIAGASQAQSYQFVALGSGSATGINSLGQVVGYSSVGATLWSGGSVTALADGTNGYPYAIADSGTIVGAYSTFNSGNPSAIRWSGSTVRTLPSDMGFGTAYAINKAGQIVGNGGWNATLWSGGSHTNLTLADNQWSGTATGINNAGLISGYARENNGLMQAVSWTTAGGNATVLNTLGGNFSQASAVNNAGEIVGSSTNSSGQVFATLWNGIHVVNLNSYLTPAELQAGWVLTEATGINQNGWIVGDAVNTKRGGSDVFELRVPSPVPEADTWAMLACGLALIGFVRFKRSRASSGNFSPRLA